MEWLKSFFGRLLASADDSLSRACYFCMKNSGYPIDLLVICGCKRLWEEAISNGYANCMNGLLVDTVKHNSIEEILDAVLNSVEEDLSEKLVIVLKVFNSI